MSTPQRDPAGAAGEQAWPDPRYAWYVISVLMVAYTFSYIDRTILALLVEPVRADLGISDTQFSLLHGFAFAVFYTIMGIPLGRMADRMSRRGIIAAGIAFWSLATAACGLARNFWQLFLARVGVGVGEAALSPAAYSMIADYFPPQRLGRALSVYAIGVYIGSGAAFLIGGAVIAAVATADNLVLPLVGEMRPWQVVFFIVGFPGVLVALWMMTIREPVRRGLVAGTQSGQGVPLSRVFGFIRENRATIICHFAGFSLLAMLFNAVVAWLPALFIRTHGWSAVEIGTALGLILGIFGTAGIVSGGFFGDWLTRRGYRDSALRASVIGTIVLWPCVAIAPLLPDPRWSLVLFCPVFFFSSFPFGMAAAALQLMSPNQLRGQISACYLFCVNFAGIGFGPTATALVTDFVFRDDQRVGWSIALVAGTAAPLALVLLGVGMRHYRDSLNRVERTRTTG